MDKNAKIYVAGHTGLVGSAIMRELSRQGFSNIITRTIAELDLRNQHDVHNFFVSEKPEYVLLAAAKVGGINANNTYKAEFIYDNMMIATNVIHAAYKSGVKKLINLGSSCIYPKLAQQPLKEKTLLTGLLEPTNEPYAIAKIAAIKLCRYYNQQYGTNFISVMPTNMYGPNDNYNLETAHVLPALIRKFYLAKLLQKNDMQAIYYDINRYPLGYGIQLQTLSSFQKVKAMLSACGIRAESVKLWGTGKVLRELMHADDLARSLIYLLKNYNADQIGEFINAGTGVDFTIADLATYTKNVVGFTGEILWDEHRPDGTPKKLLDVSRINELGWRAKIDLWDGITRTYQEYCKAQEKRTVYESI